MEKDSFDKFWNNNLYSNATKLEKKYLDYLTFDSSKKDSILSDYNQYRTHYKEHEFGGEDRIDRHKVASFMVCAVINQEPMKLKSSASKKSPFEVRASNELLALLSGLDLLKSYMVEELKRDRASASYIQGIRQRGLFYPPGKHHYLMHLTKDIHLCRCEGEKVLKNRLIPMLFHVFFFIERYNLLQFQTDYQRK